jgi:hypothetical protein
MGRQKPGESMKAIYWKGDLAEFTGNTMRLHGGLFYEYRLLEGHRKGDLIVSMRAPEVQ